MSQTTIFCGLIRLKVAPEPRTGEALARTTLAAWDLINGRLARPFDLGLKLAKTYWIVCPKATSMKPKISTFRDWLLAEAADDARRLRKRFASESQ